jgi:hypothetical protein
MTLEDIITFVGIYFNTNLRTETKVSSYYRMYYYYLATKYKPLYSLSQVGEAIDRTHATVLNGVRNHAKWHSVYKDVQHETEHINNAFVKAFPEVLEGLNEVDDYDTFMLRREFKRVLESRRKLRNTLSNVRNKNRYLQEKLKNIKEIDVCVS